jgi:nucleotide-binding universal stress UspA family protein
MCGVCSGRVAYELSEKVVLVIDGGLAGDRALEWTLARAAHIELDVRLTAIDDSGSLHSQPEKRLRTVRALSRAAAQFAQSSSQSKVEIVLLRGGAVDQLARESERADIVVLGSASVSALRGIFNASIPLGFAPRSSCPVVIVPTDWVASSGPVVVGIDEPTSLTAHEFAAREAERLDRELVLVRAWELPPMVTTEVLGAGSVEETIRDANAELLATAAFEIERRHGSLAMKEKLSFTTPSRALAAGGEGTQLVVIGTHHRRTLAEWMLGSVGHDLLMHLSCPVAIVPPVVSPTDPIGARRRG